MSDNNIIKLFSFEQLASPEAAKQAMERQIISSSILNINDNVSEKTCPMLKSALMKWIDMPMLIWILQPREIDYLIDMLEQEKLYRENHKEVM